MTTPTLNGEMIATGKRLPKNVGGKIFWRSLKTSFVAAVVPYLAFLYLSTNMLNAAQKVDSLNAGDRARLAAQRANVEQFLSPESQAKYGTVAGKLGLLRALLATKTFDRTQTRELQDMGVVLGDAFVQQLGMEWVMVTDDQGRDPAIRWPNTEIILYPLTMISKRLEKGEAVDIFDLFNGLVGKVEALAKGKGN